MSLRVTKKVLVGWSQGSALTETIILCLVMIPLVSMLPMIGKIIDLKQTTIQASRYAAWEQTVGDGATSDIRARFYQDPLVQLKTGQVEQMNESAVNPLWRTENGDTQSDVTHPMSSDIRISFAEGAGHMLEGDVSDSGVARSMGVGIEKTGEILDFMGSVKWDVEGDGMLNAGVQVNVRANQYLNMGGKSCTGQQSDTMFACVTANNVIMVDGWDSGSNSQAEDRSRAFVPAVVLEDIGKGLSKLGAIPTFKELKGLKSAFGYVDSTQLPLDRYTENYQRAE